MTLIVVQHLDMFAGDTASPFCSSSDKHHHTFSACRRLNAELTHRKEQYFFDERTEGVVRTDRVTNLKTVIKNRSQNVQKKQKKNKKHKKAISRHTEVMRLLQHATLLTLLTL